MPEFRELAYKMRDAYEASTPTDVDWWTWHVPMVGERFNEDDAALDIVDALKVSAGRCARTSYLTHDGHRDITDDVRLYEETLAKKGHWSPLEHQAVCVPPGALHPHAGNFARPWYQFRHMVEYGALSAFADLYEESLSKGKR